MNSVTFSGVPANGGADDQRAEDGRLEDLLAPLAVVMGVVDSGVRGSAASILAMEGRSVTTVPA